MFCWHAPPNWCCSCLPTPLSLPPDPRQPGHLLLPAVQPHWAVLRRSGPGWHFLLYRGPHECPHRQVSGRSQYYWIKNIMVLSLQGVSTPVLVNWSAISGLFISIGFSQLQSGSRILSPDIVKICWSDWLILAILAVSGLLAFTSMTHALKHLPQPGLGPQNIGISPGLWCSGHSAGRNSSHMVLLRRGPHLYGGSSTDFPWQYFWLVFVAASPSQCSLLSESETGRAVGQSSQSTRLRQPISGRAQPAFLRQKCSHSQRL